MAVYANPFAAIMEAYDKRDDRYVDDLDALRRQRAADLDFQLAANGPANQRSRDERIFAQQLEQQAQASGLAVDSNRASLALQSQIQSLDRIDQAWLDGRISTETRNIERSRISGIPYTPSSSGLGNAGSPSDLLYTPIPGLPSNAPPTVANLIFDAAASARNVAPAPNAQSVYQPPVSVPTPAPAPAPSQVFAPAPAPAPVNLNTGEGRQAYYQPAQDQRTEAFLKGLKATYPTRERASNVVSNNGQQEGPYVPPEFIQEVSSANRGTIDTFLAQASSLSPQRLAALPAADQQAVANAANVLRYLKGQIGAEPVGGRVDLFGNRDTYYQRKQLQDTAIAELIRILGAPPQTAQPRTIYGN